MYIYIYIYMYIHIYIYISFISYIAYRDFQNLQIYYLKFHVMNDDFQAIKKSSFIRYHCSTLSY